MTPEEIRAAWDSAKATTKAKRACPRHRFDVPENRKFGQRFTCHSCGVEMKLTEIGTYIQGYEAHGGNADDIVTNYRGKRDE